MFNHLFSHRMRKLATPIALGLSLALLTLVLNARHYSIASGKPAQVTSVTSSTSAPMFAVYAIGDPNNALNILLLSSDITINDGSIYSGGDVHVNNVIIHGDPTPVIYAVGQCVPSSQCISTGAIVINGAIPLPTPQLYDLSDFQPGGKYATAAGAAYHYVSGDLNSTMSDGLYYVIGTVNLHTVSGNVSIVAEGNIKIAGLSTLTTFDPRFPLFFSTSPNTSTGAIQIASLDSNLTGNLYAPNGTVIMSAVSNLQLRGVIYARYISVSGSRMTITCPICNTLSKAVTPSVNVPYQGVVTYTIILKNTNVISDTSTLLTDTLPMRVTFGQWLERPNDGVIQNDGAITWTNTLTHGTTITFSFTATNTNSSGNVVTNTAYFSNTWGTGSDDAVFTILPISYTLTISTAGNGNGVVTPMVGVYSYTYGTAVTLTASANTVSTFTGWSGNADCTDGSITMDTDKTCIATFVTYRVYLPITIE